MRDRWFKQVDVFGTRPYLGNPVAVVLDADGLSESAMAAFARWTNLSETTFLLPPTQSEADYRVRIFTPGGEIPFAGHPTLGSCHAWLEAGNTPHYPGVVIQECGVGLVTLHASAGMAAFGAPPLIRSGDLEDSVLAQATKALGLKPEQVKASNWIDNGPGWLGLLLSDAETVLSLKPDAAALGSLAVGVIGPQRDGGDTDFEVRAFAPGHGVPEDPVTGSLNAGLAQWLIGAGLAPDRYTVTQGTVLGRDGLIRIFSRDRKIWIGGETATCIDGTVRI
ncbi:PhzF family phenazine biosynthesis protein [Arthrobacter zhangbolii]|uniref:PhzF family phenazine biosynthesis protein n=1 Tax=Arthrobacter zhangbolii TaxID=2886936 RepID=A0A9X1M4R2_9MICC|nr:PhzF family phenazine biosynthesis protein [Arthrobacter zhangbolii]MCC3271359.1 PhzF family phenazine biosynthesis protein [Arthrobacter zhangbolii]UON90859.1 PhzF family phenazine biosynthesis protein [Arthrobacter zhangbolii]